MSKAQLTFRSAVWNHVGKILEYVLMYGTSILIARGLGVEENGRFVGLFSLSQLLLVLCSFGLETSLNKFIPQLQQERQNQKATFVLRQALAIRLAAFFGIAVSFFLAVRFISLPLLSDNGSLLLLVLLFTGSRSLFPLFAMVLTAQLQTALTARVNLVIRSIEFVAVAVLLQYRFTVESLFILFLVTSALHVLAYATVSRMNFFGESERVEMRPIVAFGGIYWINTIVDFILGRQGDVLFLSNLLHDSSQAGLYDVAYSIAQLASMAMTVGLAGVTFATFARLAVSDPATMDRFYSFSIRMISLLTIPLYAFMLFNGKAILTVLYSQHYRSAAVLVQGIVLFRTLSRLFGGPENAEYMLSKGRVGTIVSIGVVAATTNALLNVLLIPSLGAMGAVIAGGCAIVLVNALGALAVYRISTNRIQFGYWMKLVLATVACSYVTSLLHQSEEVVSLILSGLAYLLLLCGSFLIVKPLTSEDTEWFGRVNARATKLLAKFTTFRPTLAETNVS